MSRSEGFTLVELVVVIALTGIVAGLLAGITSRPILGYVHVARRAQIVDGGDHALRRLGRDLRRALPNSVRVSGGSQALEFLNVAEGARYRAGPGVNAGSGEDHTAATDVLDFTGDASFNLLGRLTELPISYGSALPAGHRLVIYSTGSTVWSDAATDASPGAVTPSAVTITPQDDVDEDQLVLSAPFDFGLESPRKRLYVIDGPVTYLCDTGAGTLTRYWSYAIQSAQPTDPTLAPLSGSSSALLVDGITGCSFDYTPGTGQRAGLVTIDLTLARADESARLVDQVHVMNVP